MSQHISIPPRKGLRGFFATVSREEAIKENLRTIIFTEPGERFMRNDLGTPLRSQQWDPADDITISTTITHLKRQIIRYEPRIVLVNVVGEIVTDDKDGSVIVSLEIEYYILHSRTLSSIAAGIQLGKVQLT